MGLYVEEGQELVHANTKSGKGNFYMKPNGIFYISAGNAAIAETQAFLRQRPQVDLVSVRRVPRVLESSESVVI